jgi:O-antigen/teichoic acid export membrane protein
MTDSFETNPSGSESVSGKVVATDAVRLGDASSRSSRIGRNTAINVVGAVLPLFLSLATVPAYLHLIGEARYGVLAVVWVVLGYFGVFDLGLSRTIANQIARMRDEPQASRERVFWTALSINATMGAIGGLVLLLFGHVLLGHVLKVSPDLHSEVLGALPWLGLAVPLTTVTLVLAGTLEGRERFLTVNLLAISGLAMFQLAPLAYAYWVSPDLAGLIMAATLALAASTALSFVVTAASLPVTGRPRPDRSQIGVLFRYGGWITVSGLVGPLLTVVDRVLIGAVLGAKSVTHYTVPFTLVSRTTIISGSLARTLFPRFSMLDKRDATDVGREAVRVLAAAMTPTTVIGAVLLEPFLRAWVGDAITRSAAPVGEILFLGMWLNGIAVIPYGFLHARGRPDLTAKFHLLEVVPYIGALVLGLHFAGIQGAAWAWTARAGTDAALLFWAARAATRESEPADLRRLLEGAVLVTAACVFALTVFDNVGSRSVLGGSLIVLSVWWGWRQSPDRVRLLITRRGRN